MLFVLYNTQEFQHVPIRERRDAAWEARQSAMRHWQFWAAIGFVIVATTVGSLIARSLFGGEPSGTIGAVCGFATGMVWYGCTLSRIGMPYYREILSERQKNVR